MFHTTHRTNFKPRVASNHPRNLPPRPVASHTRSDHDDDQYTHAARTHTLVGPVGRSRDAHVLCCARAAHAFSLAARS